MDRAAEGVSTLHREGYVKTEAFDTNCNRIRKAHSWAIEYVLQLSSSYNTIANKLVD